MKLQCSACTIFVGQQTVNNALWLADWLFVKMEVWTGVEVFTLINFYEQNRCLYDVVMSEYRDKIKKKMETTQEVSTNDCWSCSTITVTSSMLHRSQDTAARTSATICSICSLHLSCLVSNVQVRSTGGLCDHELVVCDLSVHRQAYHHQLLVKKHKRPRHCCVWSRSTVVQFVHRTCRHTGPLPESAGDNSHRCPWRHGAIATRT